MGKRSASRELVFLGESATSNVSCRSLWQRCVHCWLRHFWFELVMRASSSSGLVQRWFRFGSALVQVWFISGPSPEVLLRGESESLIPQDVLVRCMSKHFAAEDHADTLSSKFNLARRRLFAQSVSGSCLVQVWLRSVQVWFSSGPSPPRHAVSYHVHRERVLGLSLG